MKKVRLLLLFAAIATMSFGQARKNATNVFDPSFTHVVYFWLANPDSEEDRVAFESSLKKFLENSAYAKTKFIGTPPDASRDIVDGSFTYSLIVTFESAEAQQNYQDEAAHKLFIEESKHLWTKVIVYDATGI